MGTANRTQTSLRVFVDTHAPMPAPQAALFVADLADELAQRHAAGAAQGALADTVTVREADSRMRPVPGRPADPSGRPEEDVRELGVLLRHLLGNASADAGPLWTIIRDVGADDPFARPPAVVVARRLRDVARDLLLDEASWPTAPPPPGYVPGEEGMADEASDEFPSIPRRRRRGWVIAGAAGVTLATAATATAVALAAGDGNGSGDSGGRASAQPSVSQGPPVQVCVRAGCDAKAVFRPDGDRFEVCDGAKDGWSAVAVYTRGDRGGETAIWASNGAGTCLNQAPDLPEGTTVTVKACLGERPTNRVLECGAPVTARA
jgi:hypothetical protein